MSTATTYRLVIEGWRPALTNELMGHPMKARRLKARDAEALAEARQSLGVPDPTGPRLVRLTIRGPFRRRPDPDAPFKSLLDGLTRAGLILDDSADKCRWEQPVYEFQRERYTTEIEIEDIPNGS
jgi:Holliday junction resolvase RusA-like endonuclease